MRTYIQSQDCTSSLHEFLDKYHFQTLNYAEVCKRLALDSLFVLPQELNGEDEDEIAAYWDETFPEIFYHHGDLEIEGDLPSCFNQFSTIVIHGNLKIAGWMHCFYYVSGDSQFDCLRLKNFQHTKGREEALILAELYGDNHETLEEFDPRTLTTPLLFSWCADLDCVELVGGTTIFAIFDEYYLNSYLGKLRPNQTLLFWQDYAYALKPDYYYSIGDPSHDGAYWKAEEIAQAIKAGDEIFVEPFQPHAINHYRKGRYLLEIGDDKAAFQHFHRATELWPAYYFAQFEAGSCLERVNAFAQAIPYFQAAYQLLPTKLEYRYLESLIRAGFCSLNLQHYQQAINFANQVLTHDPDDVDALYIKAEVAWSQGDPHLAIELLQQAINVHANYDNHWLLGLIYFERDDKPQAQHHWKLSKNFNVDAPQYENANHPNFFSKPPCKVDWQDFTEIHEAERDATYWHNYLEQRRYLLQQGQHHHLYEVPKLYLTVDVLNTCLNTKNDLGDYPVSGSVISCFSSELLTRDHIYLALKRKAAAKQTDIPEHLLEADMLMLIPNLNLDLVPAHLKTYQLSLRMVEKYFAHLSKVPEAHKDKAMYLACLTGGILKSGKTDFIPAEYLTEAALLKAIAQNFATLNAIPANRFNQTVFDFAASLYHDRNEWHDLVSQHNQEHWRITRPEIRFHINDFQQVWLCFWDQDWVVSVYKNSVETKSLELLAIPEAYINYELASLVVAKSAYEFSSIPLHLRDAGLCELACTQEKGNALEHVPVHLRSLSVCKAGVMQHYRSYRYVPLSLRTAEFSRLAYEKNPQQLDAIPYEHYVDVFSHFLQVKNDIRHFPNYHYLRGVGYFYQKEYTKAIEDIQACLDSGTKESHLLARCWYMLAWCANKLGDHQYAENALNKAVEIDHLALQDFSLDLNTAQLPPISIAEILFDARQYDKLMQQLALSYQDENWSVAAETLSAIEKLLRLSQCSEMNYWACLWDNQRFYLLQTKQIDAWRKHCTYAIRELSKLDLFAYLSSDNPKRAALRHLYNDQAYDLFSQAKDSADLKQALLLCERCVNTISPIEDKNSADFNLHTQVLILSELVKYSDTYQNRLSALQQKLSATSQSEEERMP